LIEQISNIPFSRGLGSSSACIVGGLLGANRLMGDPLSREELMNLAASLEGHPDNIAPAFQGGFVAAVLKDGRIYSVKQDIPDDLAFVAIVPDYPLPTSSARAALPKEIRHCDGVYNLSRAALMAVSLTSGRYENLAVAAEDCLHQPFRMPLMPGADRVMDQCGKLGSYCAYISGAGSTIMAVLRASDDSFADAMRGFLDEEGLTGWKRLTLSADNCGARIL
jgi:homoserine kinase